MIWSLLDAPSRSPQAVQAVRISLGVRLLEAPAADPLDAGGGAARRGLPRLGAEADRPRAQPAHPDLPLLHPGRRRGAGLLPRQIWPGVQADRDQDDADRLLQHGDGAHRRLLAPARHDRHARERIWHVPSVQGDEGQARLSRHVRRRQRRGHRPHARHVRRLHRGAAAVRQLRHADELPALQQDEGHGPDRQLERARREPALRGHHPPVPRLRQGARLPDQGGQAKTSSTSARRRCGSRTRSSTSPSRWARCPA